LLAARHHNATVIDRHRVSLREPDDGLQRTIQYSAPLEIRLNALEYWMPPPSRGMTTFLDCHGVTHFREKHMNTTAMLRAFCDAVEQRNGAAFAALFTEDGVYHDVFYGAFAGRAKIAGMIDNWFYRTATDFRWDMHAPVSDGETLYARYTFSYRSTLPEAKGARAMFEGVAIMKLRDGLIAEYHEVANTATGFVDMNFAPERIAKIIAKQGAALKARPEMKRHLEG
jgi:ketosteroid isomerase-like protein